MSRGLGIFEDVDRQSMPICILYTMRLNKILYKPRSFQSYKTYQAGPVSIYILTTNMSRDHLERFTKLNLECKHPYDFMLSLMLRELKCLWLWEQHHIMYNFCGSNLWHFLKWQNIQGDEIWLLVQWHWFSNSFSDLFRT